MVHSFSGAHEFQPVCLLEEIQHDLRTIPYLAQVKGTADELTAGLVKLIDAGMCPRCEEPFDNDPNRLPAGSRTTQCRCVPVCHACGRHEAQVPYTAACWPIGDAGVEERDEYIAHEDSLSTAYMTRGLEDELEILTDEGVGDVKMRPNPGGWVEFGHDEGPDRADQ